MARALNRLTVKSAAGLTKPGLHADGGGLYLNVKASGARSWLYVYQWLGKRREMGLGPLHVVSLPDAREKRDRARRLVSKGEDPLAIRAPSTVPTFGASATTLIDDLELGWKNAKHRQQWRNTLETYCAGIWDRPVDLIDAQDVIGVLRPIWGEKRETAARLRGRMERVLDVAKIRGHRIGDNPARWRGHLQHVMPQRPKGQVRHHPSMPYDAVPDFVRGLKTRVSTAARALEFLILTAARTGEVIGATWSEVDMEAATWTVPAERMKMDREHVVPLTEPALKVLRALEVYGSEPDKPIFPSQTAAKLSNMAMEMLLRRMGSDDYTVHGFRSSFRDWAGEETDFQREIAEMALAHLVGNDVERAYRRGTALAKRRELMEAWALHVGTVRS